MEDLGGEECWGIRAITRSQNRRFGLSGSPGLSNDFPPYDRQTTDLDGIRERIRANNRTPGFPRQSFHVQPDEDRLQVAARGEDNDLRTGIRVQRGLPLPPESPCNPEKTSVVRIPRPEDLHRGFAMRHGRQRAVRTHRESGNGGAHGLGGGGVFSPWVRLAGPDPYSTLQGVSSPADRSTR